MSEKKSDCIAEKRAYIIAINDGKQRAFLYRPRCKKWDCPYCAERNTALWQFVGASGAEKLAETNALSFVTITCRGYHSPEQTIAALNRWHRVRKRIAYYHGPTEYLVIPERHKNGRVHLHGIFATQAPIKQRWLKDHAFFSGFGYIANVKPVGQPLQVIGYISKYIDKQLTIRQWPPRFRRVRKSTGWPMPDKTELPDWRYEAYTSAGDAFWNVYLLEDSGYTVSNTHEGLLWPSMQLAGLDNTPPD